MIIIPSTLHVAKETHAHKCPFCQPHKNLVMEGNMVCQKQLAGTGLEHHTFPCMVHAAMMRRQWGIDTLMDALMDANQAQRLRHEWPDEQVARREAVEARVNTDVATALKEPE